MGYCGKWLEPILLRYNNFVVLFMTAFGLPDITLHTRPAQALALPWVGMQNIALPVILANQPMQARIDAGVSLDDPQTRGIHMSRLYLTVAELTQQALTPILLEQVLARFLLSHQGLSQQAFLRVAGEVLLPRPALVSPLSGWKAYPAEIDVQLGPAGLQIILRAEVAYSSTCPCSAALARQLIQQRFLHEFADRPLSQTNILDWLGSEQGIIATPHSQRSYATLQLRLAPEATQLPFQELVDSVEQSLSTPVQTAVKRADEQAFALANGQNLMFCEDAARRLHHALSAIAQVSGFHLRVIHAESLHAHDAVAESAHNWPA